MTRYKHWAPAAGVFAGLVCFAAAAAIPGEIPYKTVSGAAPVPITDGAGLRSREELETFLDGVMADQIASHEVVGAVVAVVKDGELYFAKGYGHADRERRIPMDARRHLIRPGSVSKLFTWTALMQLVEQGLVDLDTDVNEYLESIQLPDTFEQPITPRNLMTHTAGLEDGGLGYLITDDEANLEPLAQFLAKHHPERIWPPTTDFSSGEGAAYSNWGTALAGVIIEDLTGQSFDDYVREHILEPLGMSRSTFAEPLPPELAADMATGYTRSSGRLEVKDFEFVHNFGPAGSLTSSAPDMARFMIAHLQNGRYGDTRILEADTARLMHSRQFSPSPYVNGSGLGFYENRINGRRLLSHGGDTQAFHSDLQLLKEEGVGLFVSYNSSAAFPIRSRTGLLRAFMDRYFPAELPRVGPPEDFAERAERYAGSYRFTRHNYSKNEKLFAAFNAMKVAPTEDNTLLISGPLSPAPAEWVEIAPDTFRRIDRDDTTAFLSDADGEVTHMTIFIPFIAAYKLALHQTREFHAVLVALAVFAAIGAIVGALRHRREAAPGATWARWAAAANGLLVLALLGGLVGCLAVLMKNPIAGWPQAFHAVLAVILVSLVVSLAVTGLALQSWRGGWFTLGTRIRYSLTALAFLGLMWSLNYWNLVGYHFG